MIKRKLSSFKQLELAGFSSDSLRREYTENHVNIQTLYLCEIHNILKEKGKKNYSSYLFTGGFCFGLFFSLAEEALI